MADDDPSFVDSKSVCRALPVGRQGERLSDLQPAVCPKGQMHHVALEFADHWPGRVRRRFCVTATADLSH